MSVKSALVKQIEYRSSDNTPTWTAMTLLDDAISIAINNDLVGRGTGDQKTIGRRRTISFVCTDVSLFETFNTQMHDITTYEELRITWLDGSTSTFDTGRVLLSPVVGRISDLSKFVFAAVDGPSLTLATGIPPDGADWTAGGTVWGDAGATFTPNSRPDGNGLPVWTSGNFEQILEVDFDKLATVVALEDGSPRTVALTHPDGTWRRYATLYIEADRMDNVGGDTHRTTRVRLHGAYGNWMGTLPVSTNPAFLFDDTDATDDFGVYLDWVNGFRVDFTCFGYDESDFLTEA